MACYILDDEQGGAWAIGGAARWWLHHSLQSLGAALTKAGLPLVLRRGDSVTELVRLVHETGAAELHVGQPVEPAARDTMRKLAEALKSLGCTLRRHWTTLLFDPDRTRTKSGTPYGVYTPFAKACIAQGVNVDKCARPVHIEAAPSPPSDRLDDWRLLPNSPDWAGGLRETWTPGEHSAQATLETFVDTGLRNYDKSRNLPGVDGISRLSPHLHWGEISPRAVWIRAAQHRGDGPRVFLSELLWREFSAHLLWHHPGLPDKPLRAQFSAMRWRTDQQSLSAWQRGATGIPIVDAGMRQLWHTGWQHNRVRMITASFLIKHLLIDWREGEKWFWDTLVDANLASNSANWQWVAGCGADAAPFFRVFNPILQSKKFDADAAYLRRWLPELRNLDHSHMHAPWEAPDNVLAEAGVVIGKTYPAPIIDLAAGRARALQEFRHVSAKANK